MTKIDVPSLLHLLQNVNGSSFITLDTFSVPEMNRTIGGRGTDPNPHFGRILKGQIGSNVMVFQNKTVNGYKSMVKRRLIAEGKDPDSFELSPRRWGVRLPNLPVVEHESKLYLEVIFLHPGDVVYYLDGYPIERDDIIGLRRYPYNPEQGGLAKKVQLRCFDFDSIHRITIDGHTYYFPR